MEQQHRAQIKYSGPTETCSRREGLLPHFIVIGNGIDSWKTNK
jgi:hypothetical protein